MTFSLSSPKISVGKLRLMEGDNMKNLANLKPGESGIVHSLTAEGAVKHHFLDLGITKGVRITIERIAPFGDPIAVRLRGYSLSLRREEAAKICLEGDQ